MKKKQNKKQEKCTYSDGVFTGIAAVGLAVLLGLIICLGYEEYTTPEWQECYVMKEDGQVFAQVDSIYNDQRVLYYYADLRDYTYNWKERDTDDFLDMYSKTDNCEFFNISKQIIKLQESKK